MRGDFVLTRAVLALAALVGLAWLGTSLLAPDQPVGDPTGVAHATSTALPTLPNWEQELLAPEIQSLWHRRRSELDDLSRAYLAEPDSARAHALRQDMQHLIDRSLWEVLELRLAHARRDGHDELARRLERALADLPPLPPDTQQEATRTGG